MCMMMLDSFLKTDERRQMTASVDHRGKAGQPTRSLNGRGSSLIYPELQELHRHRQK